MLRGLIAYLVAVLIFGTLMGWSISSNSQSTVQHPFGVGYVFHALLWGGLFFNGFIRALKINVIKRLLLMALLATTAAAIAYLYFSGFAGQEMTENLLAGWGDDRTTYKEYPIKGYELMAIFFIVIYLVLGIGQWLLSLHPKLQ